MKWAAQVRHVVAKDVREHWRFLSLYVAVVLVATLHATGVGPFGNASLSLMMVLVVLLGVMLLATVVQGDSPTRTDAFWLSHPFTPSAVLGAKVAFALLLLGVALAGQVLGVLSYGMVGVDALPPIGYPAILYAAWLVAALCIAALVRDLKSFALVIVALQLALTLVSVVAQVSEVDVVAGVIVRLLGIIAQLALLVWLYPRRENGLWTRAIGFSAAISALLLVNGASFDPFAGEMRRDLPRPPFTLDPQWQLAQRGQYAVALRMPPLPEDLSFALDDAFIELRLRDGSSLHLPASQRLLNLNGGPFNTAMPRLPGIHIVRMETRSRSVGVTANVTRDQWRRIEAGVDRVIVGGRMLVARATPGSTLPLRLGSQSTVRGRRVRIDGWKVDFDDPVITLNTSAIVRSHPLMGDPWWHGTSFALLDDTRHEIRELRSISSGGSIAGLVLPGSGLESVTRQVSTGPPRANSRVALPRSTPKGAGAEPVRDTVATDPSLRDARLMVVEHAPLGGYHFRVEGPAPIPVPRNNMRPRPLRPPAPADTVPVIKS